MHSISRALFVGVSTMSLAACQQPQSPSLAAYAAQPETAQIVAQDYCREFTKSIVINRKSQKAYGTACMQPDGSWVIVDDNHPNYTIKQERIFIGGQPSVIWAQPLQNPTYVSTTIATYPQYYDNNDRYYERSYVSGTNNINNDYSRIRGHNNIGNQDSSVRGVNNINNSNSRVRGFNNIGNRDSHVEGNNNIGHNNSFVQGNNNINNNSQYVSGNNNIGNTGPVSGDNNLGNSGPVKGNWNFGGNDMSCKNDPKYLCGVTREPAKPGINAYSSKHANYVTAGSTSEPTVITAGNGKTEVRKMEPAEIAATNQGIRAEKEKQAVTSPQAPAPTPAPSAPVVRNEPVAVNAPPVPQEAPKAAEPSPAEPVKAAEDKKQDEKNEIKEKILNSGRLF